MAARARIRLRLALLVLATLGLWRWEIGAALAADGLPSWSDGPAKAAIVDFVSRVTREGGAEYVDPAERIATFDNDGTLWAEQPVYFQLAFAIDRVKAQAPAHPEWAVRQPFKSALDGDLNALLASGEKGMLALVAASHAGMSTEEFRDIVAEWFASARHPRFDKPYSALAYQPMLELLDYLRNNGFKTFIVSGGGVEFMRVFAEGVYGIPPEQVIGSSGVLRYEIGPDGEPRLMRVAEVAFIDDGPGKPVGISRSIGRRPIFAFGNSDGDLQMLQWTAAREGPFFAGLVRHDDAAREYAYDRKSHIGRLDKALDEAMARGWAVVQMSRDWKQVFPPATGLK